MKRTTNARFSVLIIAASLIFSFLGSCKKEQKRYDELTKSLAGTWKISKLSKTATEVYTNVGQVTFDACEATPDDRVCSGTIVDSLGKSFTLLVELQAGKEYDNELINIYTQAAEAPNVPLSFSMGNQFVVAEVNATTMRWEAHSSYPIVEFVKQ
jgi:hypothetical protein